MIIDVAYKAGGMSRHTLATPEVQTCLNDDLGVATTKTVVSHCVEKLDVNDAGDLVFTRTFSKKKHRSEIDDYAAYNVNGLIILSRDELETVDYIDVDGARLFLPALGD